MSIHINVDQNKIDILAEAGSGSSTVAEIVRVALQAKKVNATIVNEVYQSEYALTNNRISAVSKYVPVHVFRTGCGNQEVVNIILETLTSHKFKLNTIDDLTSSGPYPKTIVINTRQLSREGVLH